MTIYDELIEMREAGMNSTSLVFVNMISSSFLICIKHGTGHPGDQPFSHE